MQKSYLLSGLVLSFFFNLSVQAEVVVRAEIHMGHMQIFTKMPTPEATEEAGVPEHAPATASEQVLADGKNVIMSSIDLSATMGGEPVELPVDHMVSKDLQQVMTVIPSISGTEKHETKFMNVHTGEALFVMQSSQDLAVIPDSVQKLLAGPAIRKNLMNFRQSFINTVVARFPESAEDTDRWHLEISVRDIGEFRCSTNLTMENVTCQGEVEMIMEMRSDADEDLKARGLSPKMLMEPSVSI